jgi:hypothetical protein
MILKKQDFVFIFLIFSLCSISFSSSFGEKLKRPSQADSLQNKEMAKSLSEIDTLLVIHFHNTVQCSCCINVGDFSKIALDKYFKEPYKKGKIILQECHLHEDSITAKRYKVFHSTLVFNKIIKKKDYFKEMEWVWDLCENKDKFVKKFQVELKNFILNQDNKIKNR